jgi:hypothetical protein
MSNINKSRDQYVDAYSAVVRVPTIALENMPSRDDTVGLARAMFLVDSTGAPITAANPLSGSGKGYGSTATITRPADTAIYAANDVIGAATGSTAAVSFTLAPAAGDILITSAALEIDIASVVAGMTTFNLALYSVTPPSALGDNAAFDLPSGDRASFLGLFSLGTPVDLGSTLYVETNSISKQLTAAGTAVFGYLVTVGTWTPAASSVFKITLHSVAL